jgi:hypothetical protein
VERLAGFYRVGALLLVFTSVAGIPGASPAAALGTPNFRPFLSAVACPTTTVCTAVGGRVNATGVNTTLAERRNGGSWALQSTRNPTAGSKLDVVACASTTMCMAVGEYQNLADGDVYEPLVERWNGSNWAIESTPKPPSDHGGSSLTSVACPSVRVCIAVGSYAYGYPKLVTLAERWNGSNWAIESTPKPPSDNGGSSVLTDVACPSVTVCIAVGGDGYHALVERWNGRSWTLQSAPSPQGSMPMSLIVVACSSTTVCTALGTSPGVMPVAERWQGNRWAIESIPKPNANGGRLYDVACPSIKMCTALGSTVAVVPAPLVERWNGSRWAVESTPQRSGDAMTLSGIACASATVCTAVGSYVNQSALEFTLAERWNGSSWAIESMPNPAK